ncbi:GPGG-motif small membrane protein [Brevibacterium linens]|uniref:GPGG-motif small membrane protein n=1 Tax=Brevibacterium linens TaxID=1703 RepID=UPI00351225CB
MLIVLWVIAGVLALSGVLALFRKEYKLGIVCLIAACIVGPVLTAFFGGPPAGPRG